MTSVPPKGDSDKKIGAGFAPLQVTPQADPNMTVAIRAGSFWTADGVYVEYGGGNSPTVAVPGSQARFTLVCLTSAGSIALVNGVTAASPNIPAPLAGYIPLAALYVTSTTTKLTMTNVFDVRPYLQTTDSAAIQAALADRPTFTDMNNELADKADLDGTSSAVWTINVGQPNGDGYFQVYRSSFTPAIRWNNTTSKWQFTNDGTTWLDIASVSGVFMPLVPLAVDGHLATFNGVGEVDDNPADATAAVTAIVGTLGVGALADVDTTGVALGDALVWTGGEFEPAAVVLVGSFASTDLTDSANLARLNATQTFTGVNTFSNNVNVTGNVAVTGDVTVTGQVATSDDFVVLRNGAVTDNDGGLTVKRPVSTFDAQMYWDESAGAWVAGVAGSVGSILTNLGPILAVNGAAGSPSYSFTTDGDTGMYRSAADEISFSVGGVQKVRIDTSGITVFSGFFTPGTGGAGAPEFSFTNDLDTGMFRSAANEMGFSAGGVSQMTVGTAGVSMANLVVTGTVTLPAVSMTADLDMNGFKVVDMGAPTVATDAATKGYVDTGLAGKVNVTDTLALSGDVTASATALTGPATVLAATLANTAVTAGGYGAANAVGTFTVDAKGRLTAAASTPIAILAAAVTDFAAAADARVTTTGGGLFVELVGDVMSGALTATGFTSSSPAGFTAAAPGVAFQSAVNPPGTVGIDFPAPGIVTVVSTVPVATFGPAGLTLATDLAVTEGGTGASTAAGARTSLGVVIGTDVQAWDADLDAVAAGTYVGSTSITTLGTITTGVWNGTDVAVADGGTGASTASAARANLDVEYNVDVQAWLTPVTSIDDTDSPYAVGAAEEVVLADATTAVITVNLPAVASGRRVTVKKVDASANVVTVDTPGAETIDGAATYPLAAQWDAVSVVSDGVNWFVVATV